MVENNSSAKPKVTWEYVGKVSAIIALIGGAIGVYTYFFPHSPRLSAHVYNTNELLPNQAIDELEKTTNRSFYDSLKEHEKTNGSPDFEKSIDPKLSKVLDKYSDARVLENKAAFLSFESIKQKFRVIIANSGDKEAESVNIELPTPISGSFQTAFSKDSPKEFHGIMNVGSVRPKSMLWVDFWVYTNTINADDITVNYPDGSVPIYTNSLGDRTFWDIISVPALVIENFVVLLIIVGFVFRKKPPRTSQQAETTEIEEQAI